MNNGFDSSKIVYDSPCKTRKEIRFCLEKGVRINLDNLQEVDTVRVILQDNPVLSLKAIDNSLIGLRINPQVGAGSIIETSTATSTSKFGVGLVDHHADILESFIRHPFLRVSLSVIGYIAEVHM